MLKKFIEDDLIRKMKIHFFSDLHLEFENKNIPEIDADIVIAGGDIAPKMNGARWLESNFPNSKIIYIMGNHEYYSEKIPTLRDKIKNECKKLIVLENESVTFGGIHFFGATLWTDFNIFNDSERSMEIANEYMNDYKRIRVAPRYSKLRPLDTRIYHEQTIRKLTEFLANHDPEKSIVITHHAPSLQSIEEPRRNGIIAPAYASNLENLILKYQPKFWLHGHLHRTCSYKIGKTQIIQNGKGYPPENNQPADNPDFDPEFLLEV